MRMYLLSLLLLAPSLLATLFPISVSASKTTPVITFIDNQSTPFNWSSSFVVPDKYNSMTWSVSSSDYLINWAPQVSFDNGLTWHEQHRFRCTGGVCPEVTIPIISNLYRFGLGTSNGVINASAVLNKEVGANVLTLGQLVNYPFESAMFSNKHFNSITITTGGGSNPQHLTGISLQKLESNVFSEQDHVSCDGGAECPLSILPLSKGVYRVVLEGNGSQALLGAILRK